MSYVTLDNVVSSLIGAGICWLIGKGVKAARVWNIKDDIAMLQFERKHLEEIKRSSVALNRSAFKGLFFILTLMCLAQFVDFFAGVVSFLNGFRIGAIGALWFFAVGVGVNYIQRYGRLTDYAKAIQDMDSKLAKLQEKQRKLSL